VGGAIAAAARRAGLDVALAGRDDALDAAGRAEAALLCVPDAAIGDAAEAIAAAVPPLRFVGHTSGATGLERLEPARRRGAATFSLHPLQTIPGPEAELAGAPCAVAGSDPGAERLAAALARRLGMEPFGVPEEHRAAYHAAASIASNFLVALQESAAGLLDRAGIEDARELLSPLVLRTAANWAEHGGEALTGPIARGDEATVANHLEAIDRVAPELRELYETLSERTRELARGSERTRS
ncbi:MAG TPA: DUF2520 domain-containing protein, partial [Solirubrobacterales bacterium]|nr:DUF2520 domain-containing protein [Solirubrobacterales bacterium]